MVMTSPIKPHRRGDDRLISDKKSLLPPSSSRQVIQPMGRNVIEGCRSVLRDGHGDNSNSSNNNYHKEANFDSNMVIILAALLCALICALGLNSIVRCALRCSRRLAAFPDETTATDAQTGLNNTALRQIPVFIYQGTPLALGGSMSSTSSSTSSRSTECAICLGEFKQGDKIRVLPKCSHGFHVRCIDTWLLSHSSCPICRHSLLSPSAALQATTAAAATTTTTTTATELFGHHLPQDHHFGNANSPTGQSDAFVFAMDDVP